MIHTLESNILQEKYANMLSNFFASQMLSFRMTLKMEVNKLSTIKELMKILICDCTTCSSFSYISTEMQLFLTLPVTYITAKQSFSKLKLIKSYLRSFVTVKIVWTVFIKY